MVSRLLLYLDDIRVDRVVAAEMFAS